MSLSSDCKDQHFPYQTYNYSYVCDRAINAISEHHYQSNSDFSVSPPSTWPGIATDLTDKANIRGNLSRYTISSVDAQKCGIPFVLGETNTFFGHGQPGVSNAAAAALWMIDYSLQAASLGITGLYFHQGIGYNYSGTLACFRPKEISH